MGKQDAAVVSGRGRDEILARIKSAIGNRQLSGEERRALERRMENPPAGPRPKVDEDRQAQFIAKAQANLFTVECIASLQMLVPAVRKLLPSVSGIADISVAPALANLGWPADWTINCGAGRSVESLSVTLAVAGIAETGSVVFRSDPQNPTTLNFLPDVHVIVLRTPDIVAFTEDVWARMRTEGGDWPRTVNIISGPSRTADVGGVIVRPAHGPKDVHLILVDG
jgi:hypothetical protein